MKSPEIMRELNTITVIAGLAVIFDYIYLSLFYNLEKYLNKFKDQIWKLVD